MIKSIQIKRLRGVREGRLDDLTPLVVLVGPNGAGKSTVLDALLLGSSVDPVVALQIQSLRRPGLADRWLFHRSEGEIGCIATVQPNPAAKSQERHVHLALQSQRHGQQAHVKTHNGPSLRCRVVDSRLLAHQEPLHKLWTEAVRVGRRKQVEQLVGEVVPGLESIEILTEGDTPVLHFVFADHSIPVASAGDGAQMVLRFCLELASKEVDVVLLEEPEAHQHPGAIRQSAKAVWAAVRQGVQVVISTHSLELIDFLLGEAGEEDIEKLSVYRLALEDGKLLSNRLTGAEARFSRVQIEDDLR